MYDIAFTITALGQGGTERYVLDLANSLRNRGANILVIVDEPPLIRQPALDRSGITTQVINPDPSCSDATYEDGLVSLLRSTKPRLVHANGWARPWAVVAAASRSRIPLVFTRHRTERLPSIRDRLGLNRKPFALYRERRLAQTANPAIISISDLSVTRLRKRWGTWVRTARVYNGIEPIAQTAEPARNGFSPNIVWVGSMIQRKRPMLALQAFARLIRQYPTAKLRMFGEGPLLKDVRRAAERLPHGSVATAGYADPTDALIGADLLLQTAADEGIPYAVLEAMRVGLPVLATDGGATSEAVISGETGNVVPVDNARALTSCLIGLSGNPGLRSKFGAAGRKLFCQRFTLDRMVSETIAAYAALCDFHLDHSSPV